MDSLSEEQIEYLKDTFHLLDKNQNDKIELNELADGLRAMGMNPSQSEVTHLMESFDRDGDSSLSFEEFTQVYIEFCSKTQEKENDLKKWFEKLDLNSDGKISRDELRVFLTSGGEAFSEDEIEKVFNEFDSDNDGFISVKELTSALLSPD